MQLEAFLEDAARQWPDKTALVCDGRRLTYAEVEATANHLAHALLAEGLERGDRVVIWLDNSPEAAIAVFAVLKAGGVFVMVNPTTKPDKLTYLLNNSRARILICPAQRTETLHDCWDQTPHLESVVMVGQLSNKPSRAKRFAGWDELLERHVEKTAPPPKRTISIDLAALVYTSGSTGNPKGVMLTHLNMVTAATSITTYLQNRHDDIVLNVLPLSFDYGLYQWLMVVKFGGTLVLEKSFTYPHAVLNRLIQERVTGFPIVPTILAILLQMDLRKYDLSHLRYVTNTGAALPTEYIARLRQLLPDVTIFSMYGLTECKRVAYLPPEEIDRRPNSVGRAMPNCEVYLVDVNDCRVGPGVVGELVVRGANVMQGYWEAPEETARRLKPGALPNERVLYTGDLFRTDTDGFLYWVGRRDDIIKSRGEKVSPKEVEDVLCRHPQIAEAAVVGVPDAILGQAIRAVISLCPDAHLSEKDVIAYCRQHLEDFMVPRQIEIRGLLPRTANGKIDKTQLCEIH